MIMELEAQGYREDAIKAYEEKCEFVGCGWNAASCDVHHINYKEHAMVENGLRAAYKTNMQGMVELYEKLRMEHGFGAYDTVSRQLPKQDDTKNLAILCPNHHRYVHTHDLGMELLNFIPKRKTSD